MYELRIYTIIPEKMTELLTLWENEGKPLIDKFMNLIGLWKAETGDINKIYHLYHWESLDKRTSIREDFYRLPETKEYVKKIKKCYLSQESVFLNQINFQEVKKIGN